MCPFESIRSVLQVWQPRGEATLPFFEIITTGCPARNKEYQTSMPRCDLEVRSMETF